jgi:hypothetical protein
MPVRDRCGTDPARTGAPGDFLRARENSGARTTCDYDRKAGLSCVAGRPRVSAVVRDPPVECGPDVAPRSRAWKARPVLSSGPDARPVAQVRPACDRPLLTVRHRQTPMLRARGGHGRRGRTLLPLGSDGHKLNRRVRPVQGDHLPRWQGPQAHGSCWGEGFEPGPVLLQRLRSGGAKALRPAVPSYPSCPLVPAESRRFPMPCGPSTDQRHCDPAGSGPPRPGTGSAGRVRQGRSLQRTSGWAKGSGGR